MRARRTLVLNLLGVALSALFIWFALRGTNFAEIGAALAKSKLWMSVPFLFALFLFYWIKTMRWAILLKPLRVVGTAQLFPAVMIGYAGNAILPMQLGELVRTYVAGRRLKLQATAVLASIALERLFDLIVILLLLGIVLSAGTRISPLLVNAGYAIAAASMFLMAALAAYALWTDRFVAMTDRLTGFLPRQLQHTVLNQVRHGAAGLDAVKEPRLLLGVAATSVLLWGSMWICVYISLLALDIDVPLSATFLVLVFTALSLALPTSPGYIGSIQLAYTLALKPYAVSAGDAFAASVFYHALAYLSVVIAGILFLKTLGYSARNIKREAERSQRESSGAEA